MNSLSITHNMTAPKEKIIHKEFVTKLLMFVITLLISVCTWVVVKTSDKVDTIAIDVQEIKVLFATYKEKVDALEKNNNK